MGLVKECRRCHETKPISAAGLCEPCLNVFRPRRPNCRLAGSPGRVRRFFERAIGDGGSMAFMAEKVGWSKSRVARWLRKFGLRTSGTITAFQRERLRIAVLSRYNKSRGEAAVVPIAVKARIEGARLGWPGLTAADARVVEAVRAGATSVQDVHRALGLKNVTYTYELVAKLKRAGLVEDTGKVHKKTAGARCKTLALTAKARGMWEAQFPTQRPRSQFTARTHKVAPLRP